jgi:hypothetical protein
MSLTKARAREIALSFPGTSEKVSQGSSAIYVGAKFLTRTGSRERGTLIIRTNSFAERDMLIESDPETFFVTEHFRSYCGALARLEKLDEKTFRALLERRWKTLVPKKLSKAAAKD